MAFQRYLPEELADALEALAAAKDLNWWKETLSHPDLDVAIRDGYVSVYAQGQSIFRIELIKKTLIARMHYKYLLKPTMPSPKQYIEFCDGDFKVSADPAKPPEFIQTSYRVDETLGQMIKAATLYAGPEKQGVHILARKHPGMVDLEIAFNTMDEEQDPTLEREDLDGEKGDEEQDLPLERKDLDGEPRRNRIDLAVLHPGPVASSSAHLVFYEVKRAADPRLWGVNSEVSKQLRRYDAFLADETQKQKLVEEYKKVCAALVRLRRHHPERLHPIVHAVAKGEKELEIDPRCRLVVFGFNREEMRQLNNRQQEPPEQLKQLWSKLRDRLIAGGSAKWLDLSKTVRQAA
jgi:hypothetical protein